jgi:hypothetical protein
MKPSTVLVHAAPFFLTALGCGGGGAQPTMCVGANIVASETSNYAFSSTIKLSPVTVAPMSNLAFDWSGLTKDFLGHPLAPATDLGSAIMMIWNLTLADFETALNADTLYTADLVVSPPLNLPLAGATSGQLYDFMINGTAASPATFNAYFDAALYTPANSAFIIGVQTGTDPGRQMRMLQSFNLDASSSVTNVTLTDNSTKLTYSANLRALTITGVPGGTAALTLDWTEISTPSCTPLPVGACPTGSTMGTCPATGMQSCLHYKRNALGHDFKDGYVTSAIVGHYAQTPAELEADFLDLDRIAMATYRADIQSGSVLDFTMLEDDSGAAFPGIDDNGTWLVGLFCGNCRNPAPWYMTILKTCSM